MVPVPAIAADEQLTAEARMHAIYDAHAKPLYRFLLRLTFGERQAAEDLLQETLLRAWRKIEDLNADIGTLRPWLLTVARRLAIDAGRAKQARPAEVWFVDTSALPAGDDSIERLLAVHSINKAMSKLTREHRSVIIEIYYRGRSGAEAAAALGIPEGTVKSRAYYALRSLRAALGSSAVVPALPGKARKPGLDHLSH